MQSLSTNYMQPTFRADLKKDKTRGINLKNPTRVRGKSDTCRISFYQLKEVHRTRVKIPSNTRHLPKKKTAPTCDAVFPLILSKLIIQLQQQPRKEFQQKLPYGALQ